MEKSGNKLDNKIKKNSLFVEFDVLDEWAREVVDILGGYNLEMRERMVPFGMLVTASYYLETDQDSKMVTDVILEVGQRYSRGRRYFFSYHEEKKLMILVVHPFYLL